MRLEEAAGGAAEGGHGGEGGGRRGLRRGGQRCKGHKHSCTETRNWACLQ